MKKNLFANEKLVINYNDIEQYIPEGDRSYVAIMTTGHIADKLVLEKLVNKKLKYLGMISSKSKSKQVFQELTEAGVEKRRLELVHSPIGLNINSKTVEEIAISIFAEIIQIKNS